MDPLDLLGCFGDLEHMTARLLDSTAAGRDGGRETDLTRKIFGTMMGAYLSHLLADPHHPAFLPSVGYHQMYGSPNPDTVYRTATIDGTGRYLIRGQRGTVPDVSVMPFGPPTADGLLTFAPFEFADLSTRDDGTFELVLAQERPAAAANWWALDPAMRTLMLRSTSDAWGEHVDPRVAIIRLDVDSYRERLDVETMKDRLRSYAIVVEAMVMSGVRRAADLRGKDVINRLEGIDYSANGGRADQQYFEGCFEIGPEEALLLEVRVPTGYTGFSLSLTDDFLSTLDWANAQTSLNKRQASVDEDGWLRVVVAAEDPLVRNWLDTTGQSSGVLQCRWFGHIEAPRHVVSLVKTADLGGLLQTTARVSPTERSAMIRDRQIGVQLRSLW
jgi:hypothetical protein